MLDANARHLPKGTLFFASNADDMLYCEMLSDCHDMPMVKVISTLFDSEKSYTFNGGRIHDRYYFMPYQGFINDGELEDFINEDSKAKAKLIIDRLN